MPDPAAEQDDRARRRKRWIIAASAAVAVVAAAVVVGITVPGGDSGNDVPGFNPGQITWGN